MARECLCLRQIMNKEEITNGRHVIIEVVKTIRYALPIDFLISEKTKAETEFWGSEEAERNYRDDLEDDGAWPVTPEQCALSAIRDFSEENSDSIPAEVKDVLSWFDWNEIESNAARIGEDDPAMEYGVFRKITYIPAS